jgi:2-polyprenyl-3-methyl-5-hydroxy-6-metoxy-1,4-benzoquinol methylase
MSIKSDLSLLFQNLVTDKIKQLVILYNITNVKRRERLKLKVISGKEIAAERKEEEAVAENEQQPQSEDRREQLRRERLWEFLTSHVRLNGCKSVDLGAGSGWLSEKLHDAGADVTAVDKCLKQMLSEGEDKIRLVQGRMPEVDLPDSTYELVVCADLIAELPAVAHRLFFSELSRLLVPGGFVLCSTPIDFRTEEAVELFLRLAKTEFELIEIVASYHALSICISRLFGAVFTSRVKNWWDSSLAMTRIMERLTVRFRGVKGVSHVMFIGRRKSI